MSLISCSPLWSLSLSLLSFVFGCCCMQSFFNWLTFGTFVMVTDNWVIIFFWWSTEIWDCCIHIFCIDLVFHGTFRFIVVKFMVFVVQCIIATCLWFQCPHQGCVEVIGCGLVKWGWWGSLDKFTMGWNILNACPCVFSMCLTIWGLTNSHLPLDCNNVRQLHRWTTQNSINLNDHKQEQTWHLPLKKITHFFKFPVKTKSQS